MDGAAEISKSLFEWCPLNAYSPNTGNGDHMIFVLILEALVTFDKYSFFRRYSY